MSSKQEIHRLIGKIGSDPKLIDELMKEGDETTRKATLVKHGLMKHGDPGPSRQDIMKEMEALMTPAGSPQTPAAGGRVVELGWVGAIAAAGAGAAAAACTCD